MRLIVGLGNPGSEYEATRHNVGFWVVDRLADRANVSLGDRKFKGRLGRGKLAGHDCLFLKPQTYMNLSGESVGPALGFYKLTTADLIVIHDELDLAVGQLRLKKGGGHGGHNGLRSMLQHLADAEFSRLRIGIGRPPPSWDPADYVLSRFAADERSKIEEAVDTAADAVEAIIRDGLSRAMTVYNRASDKVRPGAKADRPQRNGDGNGQHDSGV